MEKAARKNQTHNPKRPEHLQRRPNPPRPTPTTKNQHITTAEESKVVGEVTAAGKGIGFNQPGETVVRP
jgi:hypothetical protein